MGNLTMETSGTNEKKDKNVFLEDALVVVGEGRYTSYICFVCGMATLAAMSCMQSFFYVLPTVGCELDLTTVQTTILGSLTFIGSIISSNFIGFLVDQYGRKRILLITTCGSSLSTLLASFAPNAITLMIMTLCCGLLLGGVFGLPYVYMSEFCCKPLRAKYLTLSSLIAILSNVYSPSIAWSVMRLNIYIPIYNSFVFSSWRVYIILNVLPMIASAIMFFNLPESPKFLLFTGTDSEALAVLKSFYTANQRKSSKEFPIESLRLDPEDAEKQSSKKKHNLLLNFLITLFVQMKELFSAPLLVYTFICSFLMLPIVGLYGTLLLWLPQESSRILGYLSEHHQYDLTLCEVMSQIQGAQKNTSCHVENETFLVSIIVGAGFFVLTTVMVFLVRKFKVKHILGVNVLLSSVICFAVIFFKSPILTLTSLGAILGLLSSSQPLVYGIIVDCFPTSLRATAGSVAMFFGRGAVPLGSSLLGIAFESHCTLAYMLMAGSLAVFSIVAFITPLKKKTSGPA